MSYKMWMAYLFMYRLEAVSLYFCQLLPGVALGCRKKKKIMNKMCSAGL